MTIPLCNDLCVCYPIPYKGAITGQNDQFQSESDIKLYQQNITCFGNESSLSECPISVSERTQDCNILSNAYIACQGKVYRSTCNKLA